MATCELGTRIETRRSSGLPAIGVTKEADLFAKL